MNLVDTTQMNAKQRHALIVDLLRTRKLEVMDAIQASRWLNERYGLRVDWHDCSEALDFLHRTGDAILARPGGMVVYRIK